ncbi:protein kinase domain-containing protein [Rhodococcus koreensis]
MDSFDSGATQRDQAVAIAAELVTAGFTDAVEVGRGGFGVVYRCAQEELDRLVAVKVLTADLDRENLDRFLREQRAMGRLSGHPDIVTILQVGVTKHGRPFLVMPYYPHDSLDVSIRRSGPLRLAEALHVGVRMAGALEAAHRAGILHRDVKPANILLTEYGEPQLTDFGIARIPGGFQTTAGTITGSPAFTAPEVLTGGDPAVASDVYSLGATLFCVLTGHAAFERRSGEQLVAQFLRITSEPTPRLRGEHIPRAVAAAIERAMSADPDARPVSAEYFGDELRQAQLLAGLTVDPMAIPAATSGSSATPRSAGIATHRPTAIGPQPRSVRSPTPPTPATRFRPPIPARSPVLRQRLIDVHGDGRRRRLTVIHAPAGYGKSTLAAQWQQALVGEDIRAAWLTIDTDDNNVVWFLAHLIEALRQVRPTLSRDLAQVLEEHGAQAEQYVLTTLINDIHAAAEPVALILDDWHRVTDPATIAALEFLLDNGCHHLQFIVTSRSRSGLPLSRMRVLDELVEIGADALRFDPDESKCFLVDVNGLVLADSEIARLAESTDGWVAALQLASLSLRDAPDPGALIEHLSGRHRAIGEYLVENVLDTVEPHIAEFLLATSITERICGNLAQALANVPHAQALLEEIEERDLFLRALDDDRHWFRYHHMFADFLRRRLERESPERIPHLHRAAAAWFGENGFLGESVDHMVTTCDFSRAAELLETHGMELVEDSKMSTVLGLIAKLPAHEAEKRPRLQLIAAWANAILHRPAGARAALARVKAALDENLVTGAEAHQLRLEASVCADVDAVHADAIDELSPATAEATKQPDSLRPFVVAGAASVASCIAVYRFDFAEARRWQEWAAPYHRRAHGRFGEIIGHCVAGIAAHEQLDTTAAEHNFRTALHLAHDSTGIHSYSAHLAGALLGDLLYEQGDLDQAEQLLEDSSKLGAEGGIVDLLLASYVTGARVKAIRGDFDTATEYLDQGSRISVKLSLPRLMAHINHERIRIGIGRDTAALHFEHAMFDCYQGRGVAQIAAEQNEHAVIRLLLSDPTSAHLDDACDRAAALVQTIGAAQRPRAILEATLSHVNCLAVAGRAIQARRLLARAAATCARHGLLRPLIDAGPAIMPTLTALADEQRTGSSTSTLPIVSEEFLTRARTAVGVPWATT